MTPQRATLLLSQAHRERDRGLMRYGGYMTKWADLSERDRDALVAEKVMGLPMTCMGKIKVEPSEDSSYYECASCHAVFSFAEWMGLRDDAPHTRNVPHYTTSMDAAWLVLRYISQPSLRVGLAQRPAITHFRQWFDQSHLWSMTVQDASAAICYAALRAVGVEIE